MPKTIVFTLLDCTHFEQGYNACVMGLPCAYGNHRPTAAFKWGYWWAEQGIAFPALPYGCRVALNSN